MRIIIAPAKKMIVDTDSFAVDDLPQLLERTERLKAIPQTMSPRGITEPLEARRHHCQVEHGATGLYGSAPQSHPGGSLL